MATHKIFIEDEQMQEGDLGINTSYLYREGFLRIYNKERIVYFQEAKKGDAFVVVCEKGKAFLKKMIPPHGKGALVAWLLHFNKDNRATSFDVYRKMLATQRKRRYWEGYKEREHKSQGYVFTLCNTPMDDNYRNVAGFISDAVCKKEVIELIPLMLHYPDWYTQKLLFERFGITEKEFEEARKNTFKPL